MGNLRYTTHDEPITVQWVAAKATNSSGSQISAKTRLAVTFWFLACGSHIDLYFAWGIGYSTLYSERGVLWPTIEAIDAVFYIGLPLDDQKQLEEISQGFFDHSERIFDGCTLSIDGLAIWNWQPFEHEVKYKKDCHFPKSHFAIIVIAGCDVVCHFISASCSHSGSTNDMIAWQNMYFFQTVEVDRKLLLKYFFISNEAFTNTNQFLSPWPS